MGCLYLSVRYDLQERNTRDTVDRNLIREQLANSFAAGKYNEFK